MTADLFAPFTLGAYTLRNRLGVAPMPRMSAGKEAIPRRDVLDFLVRRAQNGAALVFTEAIVTDYESAQGYPGQARILTQPQIEAWKPVTEAIRAHGAVSIMQMFHCGRMAWPEINPAARSIAPSPVTPRQVNPLTGEPYPVPDAMSRFDIAHVVNGFVETARGAVAAGFDGVEIHGAHGYLINQFLSSYSNHRTDEYGGTMANRFRFAREIIRAVHEVLPKDTLLTFRVSNWGIADMEVSLFRDAREWEELIDLIADGTISGRIAKQVFDSMYKTGRDPARIVEEEGLQQVTDFGEIEAAIDAVIAANPDKAEQTKVKPQLAGWFVGQVMKSTS
ncbi:MAG: hypothetical protein CVU63_20855, partial [Deltaproteobacteria bacterium HGW-Deltaproteobacteria-20]